MKYVIAILVLIALIVVGGAFLYAGKTIHELLWENKALKKALANLTHEDQIGYAKVLKQEKQPDGRFKTTVRFVETARGDKLTKVLERDYTINGDVVHFDALIVTFPSHMVMDGKKRSLYLWRRIYGEDMKPSDAYSIESAGEEPARYRELLGALDAKDKTSFWESVWNLSNDPDALKEHGITAVYGNVVYKQLRPGLIYVFKISNTGQLYPETVPDM